MLQAREGPRHLLALLLALLLSAWGGTAAEEHVPSGAPPGGPPHTPAAAGASQRPTHARSAVGGAAVPLWAPASAWAARWLQAQQPEPCQPWTVAPEQRCSYVIEHAASCYPDGGWQTYLKLHFCTFEHWAWLSVTVLFSGAVLASFVLLTVSERFFCPALELISEYLRLPPVVAGATLLSFGNGAPDIFTQVAAVGQGGSQAVGMALAEPLGGGLFTNNIVFGLVVLIASKASSVRIRRWPFIKDLAFYLASLLLITALLADGQVAVWEACCMGALYVVYVAATFYISRHDEPVHAALELHEVPQEEGVDIRSDTASECCSEALPPLPALPPVAVDAATSVQNGDLEAALGAWGHLPPTPTGPAAGAAPPLYFGDRRRGSVGGSPRPPLQRSLTPRQQRAPRESLREPLLPPTEEAEAPPAEEGPELPPHAVALLSAAAECAVRRGAREGGPRLADAAVGTEPEPDGGATAGVGAPVDLVPAAAAAPAPPTADQASAAAAARPPPSPMLAGGRHSTFSMPDVPVALTARSLQRHKTFSEGGAKLLEAGGAAHLGRPQSALPWSHSVHALLSPRAGSDSALGAHAYGGPLRPSASSPVALLPPGGRWTTPSPELMPLVQQLAEQHQQQQHDLLEQQHEEQMALVQMHEEIIEAKQRSWLLRQKLRLQHPLVQLLSCTMPRVGTGHGHHYRRWRACLLPFTAPATIFVAAPGLAGAVGGAGLLYGAVSAAMGSGVIWATYPSSHVPRKALKGVFAVMTFLQAVVWLNISASALVQVCVIFGVIWGVQPALLGATVLAYGNAVPDLINNLALARDGFPSMAVAACFASPLFTLLVGTGCAMGYGAVLNHGSLAVPIDGPLALMAAFGVATPALYLATVPLLYRFRMTRRLAAMAFAYYAAFNVAYVLAVVGAVRLPPLSPGGAGAGPA